MTGTPLATGQITAFDGMANVVAGLGAANAKTHHIYLTDSNPIMLEQSYRASTWFGKIVDIPADDATRKWRQWQAKAEVITALENAEKRLQVRQKVRDALILKRLHGGAVLVPSGLPGSPEKPLDYSAIGKGSLKGLTLLTRYQIQTEGRIDDVLSPYFNMPEWYVIQTGGQQVRLHPSRVIRFSERRFTHQNIGDDGWGDSIWLRMADAIQASETGGAVLAALLLEAKVDVIKMPDLTENMATERQENALMRRMTIANQLKSVANTLILDSDDDYSQKQISFQSIPDAVMLLLQIMCGVADIPMTRLLGTQAKGLANGGDADLKNYYDNVTARQELDLDPAMEPLDRMLQQHATGTYDESIWHEWRPLYQMSEKEEAEVEERYAKTAETLVNTGLFPADALQAAVHGRMIDSGSWPALEKALAEAKLKAQELINGENGYEPTAAEQAALEGRTPANDPDAPPAEQRRAANDAKPRTLYVHRPLVNADAVLSWAREQGLTDLLDPAKMHVTLAYSKMPLDWMKVGEDWGGREDGTLRVAPGGVRLVEALGDDEKAVVLLFTSSSLSWRHEQIKAAGAKWKWPDYQPHITLSWAGAQGVDLKALEAYQGELIFGPEVFAEVDENWESKVKPQ